MQIENEEGTQQSVSIGKLLSELLRNYAFTLGALSDDGKRLSEFVTQVYGPNFIQRDKMISLLLIATWRRP